MLIIAGHCLDSHDSSRISSTDPVERKCMCSRSSSCPSSKTWAELVPEPPLKARTWQSVMCLLRLLEEAPTVAVFPGGGPSRYPRRKDGPESLQCRSFQAFPL